MVEHQRRELIRTLRDAGDLTVEIQIGAAPKVRVKDGLLVEIPAGRAG